MALSITPLDSEISLPQVATRTSHQVTTTTSSLNVEVIRGDRSIISRYAAAWTELCLEGPCDLPFFTPNWITAWLESFDPSAKVVLVLAMRNGTLRGVLPFVEKRMGPGKIGFTRLVQPANIHSCRIDMVHGAGDSDDVVSELWKALQTQVKWDAIEYRDVPTGGGIWAMANVAAASGFPMIDRKTLESPVIRITPETDLDTLGPAKQLRRSRRMLEKAGGYQYIRHDPVEQESIDKLLQMEAAGWKGENGSAILCNEAERTFYTKIMSERTSAATPVMHEIRFEGKPIAFNFGIEMSNRYVEPKGSYSEEHRSYGVGHLLMHETAIRLRERGFTSFGLLGHVEPYKALWTSETLTHHQFLIFRKSPMGHAFRWGIETLIPVAKRWKSKPWREHLRSTWAKRSGATSAGSGQ